MRRTEGSVVRYKNGWRVFATLSTEDGPKRVSKVVRGTRREAERVLRELLDETPTPRTIGDLCELYLDDLERRRSNGEMEVSTIRGYKSNIECHIIPLLGKLEAEAKPGTIERVMSSLEANRLSVYKTLRQIYKWAFRLQIVASNPMDHVKSPPTRKPGVKKDEVYTAEECSVILSRRKHEVLEIAVAIALGCGLRRGEICGLDWDDYNGTHLSVTKAYGKSTPKTENGNRVVMVPEFARATLDRRRGVGPILQIDGVRTHPDTVTKLWTRFLKENPDIRKLPFKNLRHTAASLAISNGASIISASRFLGHASIYITDKFYARPSQDSIDEVGSMIGSSLK